MLLIKPKVLLLIILLVTNTVACVQGPWESGDCIVTLSDSTLTVSKKAGDGNGAMADYLCENKVPWQKYKGSIKTVVIEEGVTTIGIHAFCNCDAFSSVTIPSTVTGIGTSAFNECFGLASVTFADGSALQSIGDEAFFQCRALTSIDIPISVQTIGCEAFGGCSNLVSVAIGSGVESIGNCAFAACTSLGSVTIPSGVTTIGPDAFSGCVIKDTNIINHSSRVNAVADDYWGATIYDTLVDGLCIEDNVIVYAYKDLLSDNVTIPSGVTSIKAGVFSGCTALVSVTIPSSVTSIGARAFRNCSNLTSITIPSSVTCIGEDAFWKCTNVTDVYCYADPSMTWKVYSGGDESFKSDGSTLCHVFDKTAWEKSHKDITVNYVVD